VTARRIGPALRHASRCRHLAGRLSRIRWPASFPRGNEKRIIRAHVATDFDKREAAGELLGVLDTFPFWFNIVTP
jgi:hypothetical protein